MKTRLTSKLSVPPNPTAILDGSVSRRLGRRAPKPTLIPESPMQRTATIPTWSAIMTGLIPSIRSLKNTRPSVATSEIPTEKANLPQRICARPTGKRPSTQKLRPSSESKRENEPAGEGRQDEGGHRDIEKADEVTPRRALNGVTDPGNVEKIESEQTEKDQELRPLRRITAEGAQVFEDEKSNRARQEEE